MKRSFGQIQRLPSKRYRARYTGPDGVLHNAPATFDTREDAEAFLTDERRRISRGEWLPLTSRARQRVTSPTLSEFAERWLAERTARDGEPLRPRTMDHYRRLLDGLILPRLGALRVDVVSRSDVRTWYASLDPKKKTLRAHAFVLLRSIMASAADPEEYALRSDNPVTVKGATAAVKRSKVVRPATLAELEMIAASMPAKYRAMVMLSSWCALRFGEVTELRRKDLDLRAGIIHVRRGIVRANGERIIGAPKSDAGIRDVAIPPHLVPMLRAHLDSMPVRGRDALLFPASDGVSHIAPSTLYRVFYPARQAAGRPDLRWHDLRHTGAVLAAQTGATLAELMARLGHSTPQAAMRYQHAARDRDAQIAAALSGLVAQAADTPV